MKELISVKIVQLCYCGVLKTENKMHAMSYDVYRPIGFLCSSSENAIVKELLKLLYSYERVMRRTMRAIVCLRQCSF